MVNMEGVRLVRALIQRRMACPVCRRAAPDVQALFHLAGHVAFEVRCRVCEPTLPRVCASVAESVFDPRGASSLYDLGCHLSERLHATWLQVFCGTTSQPVEVFPSDPLPLPPSMATRELEEIAKRRREEALW